MTSIGPSIQPARRRTERLWRSAQFVVSRGSDACTSIRRIAGESEGDKRQSDRMEDAARAQAATAQAILAAGARAADDPWHRLRGNRGGGRA
jgi:hypothetical protein